MERMNGFHSLLNAYLSAHPGLLPPVDPGEELAYERDDLEWKVSVRNGGERFEVTVDAEDLLGWLWLQQQAK